MSKAAKRTVKYIAVYLPSVILVAALLFFLRYSIGNHNYHKHRDLAIAACKNGDVETAGSYIEVAIGRARDPDLIGEGRHYRFLFERGKCEKE